MARAGAGLCALAVVASACAAAVTIRLPEGPWTPDPSAPGAYAAAAAPCRGVRTLTAEIAVRGTAGSARIRGRVLAGFERGGSLRLEAPAPFGAPIFILASRSNRATLWLPRDRRVLRGEAVEEVLEAITGLRRTSDDLLALVAGCLTAATAPAVSGSRNARDWMMVDLADSSKAFLSRDGARWRITSGQRGAEGGGESWTVSYPAFAAGFPTAISVRQDAIGGAGASAATTLTLQITQLETNVAIDARAFDVAVPSDAQPLTLDDLRQSGPLADRGSGR
jgi:hypothetical protein